MTYTPVAARVLKEPLETDRGSVGRSRTDVLPAAWNEAAGELARLAGALGVDPGAAEDVLQDVFAAALEKAPRSADRTELRRWLFRVTINRCNLEHRRSARWQRVWQGITRFWGGDRAESASAAASRDEEKAMVRAALRRLGNKDRAILVLRYFQGLDSKEIGRILKMPAATVRSRLRTARRQLAEELKRRGYDEQSPL